MKLDTLLYVVLVVLATVQEKRSDNLTEGKKAIFITYYCRISLDLQYKTVDSSVVYCYQNNIISRNIEKY